MKLVTLDCSKCGAPLEGWSGRKRLRCEYCGTATRVTEAPEETQENDSPAPGTLFPSEAHKDLHDLDRRWRRERGRLASRNKNGGLVVPTNFDAILGGILIAAIGLGTLASDEGALLTPLFLLAGIAFAAFGIKRARAYASAHRRHRLRRRRVLGEIAKRRD